MTHPPPRTIIAAVFLLTTALLAAQDAPLPKYKVVKGYPSRDANAIAALNQAADEGYRLLFASRFTVLRLDAAPPDTYRYTPVPEFQGLASFLNALNQQGAFGYQWLEETNILEKEPHPRNYEYSAVEGLTQKSRNRSRDSLLAQGFHLAGQLGAQAIFIRELGTSQPAPPPKKVQAVDAMRVGTMMKKISELASQGYRYHSPEISKKGGGKALSMEVCDSTCGGPFEYRSFGVNAPAQIERDLNLLGRDGFHVLPNSLAWPPHLVERPASHAQSFVYRVFEASGEQAVEQTLNEDDRDGFVPLGFTSHVGLSVHQYIVLEKATASPTP